MAVNAIQVVFCQHHDRQDRTIIITFLMVAIMVQFVVGVFSFLLLLCCESATAGFRAALVPVLTTSVPST